MTRAHYRQLAEKRLQIIKKLTKQLQLEIQINRNLSKLHFFPVEKQPKSAITQLKRATTIKNKLNQTNENRTRDAGSQRSVA